MGWVGGRRSGCGGGRGAGPRFERLPLLGQFFLFFVRNLHLCAFVFVGFFAEEPGHPRRNTRGRNATVVEPELCKAGIAAASRVPEASQGWVEGGVF